MNRRSFSRKFTIVWFAGFIAGAVTVHYIVQPQKEMFDTIRKIKDLEKERNDKQRTEQKHVENDPKKP